MDNSFIDDAINKLDNSDLYLESLQPQTFENMDTSVGESDENNLGDSDSSSEDKLPLSFLCKREKRRYKLSKINAQGPISNSSTNTITHAHNQLERVTCIPNNEQVNTCSQKGKNLAENPRENRGRKKVRHPESWKCYIAKRRRNEGKSYINKFGILKHERKIKPACGKTCRFKCSYLFGQEDREVIFHRYWGSGDVTLQRNFLTKFCKKKKQKKRNRSGKSSNRTFSFSWYLPGENQYMRVCKLFFLNTLSISDQAVYTAHRKSSQGIIELEKRGKSNSSHTNKVTQEDTDFVISHIHSFKTVESHYGRKKSSRQYLSSNLSVAKMYEMYLVHCNERQIAPVSKTFYREIFNTKFNLGFHKPKKDQCDLCISFANADNDMKDLLKI